MSTADRNEFLRTVADEGHVKSEDAERVVVAVLRALSDFISPEAWQLIVGVVPVAVQGAGDEVIDDEQKAVKDFLLELSRREDIEIDRAAVHARVVAETTRAAMTPDQVRQLRHLLSDDFLALFETDHRGELTEDDGATIGARVVEEDWPEEDRQT